MVPVGDGKGLPTNGSRSIVGILMRNGGNSIRLPYDEKAFELAMDVEMFDEAGIICVRIPVEFDTESGDVFILLG